MKSHDYARRMQQIAEFLLSRPEFDTTTSVHMFFPIYDKDKFLGAVHAMGSGSKEFTTGSYPEVVYSPAAAPEIRVSIARDKVCRKVQDAVWECEPLLSAEEIAQVGEVPDSEGIPF